MKHSIVRLGLDLYSHPIWMPESDGKLRNVAANELPISDELLAELVRWATNYDEEFVKAGESVDPDSLWAQRIHTQGLKLWKKVVQEIGAQFNIHYDSPIHGESYRVHYAPSSQQ